MTFDQLNWMRQKLNELVVSAAVLDGSYRLHCQQTREGSAPSE